MVLVDEMVCRLARDAAAEIALPFHSACRFIPHAVVDTAVAVGIEEPALVDLLLSVVAPDDAMFLVFSFVSCGSEKVKSTLPP